MCVVYSNKIFCGVPIMIVCLVPLADSTLNVFVVIIAVLFIALNVFVVIIAVLFIALTSFFSLKNTLLKLFL